MLMRLRGGASAVINASWSSRIGFNNRGGTLDTLGMLFANRCTWAHVLEAAAKALGVDAARWLAAFGDWTHPAPDTS